MVGIANSIRRHPFLSLAQLLSAIVMFPTFFIVASFVAAVGPSEAVEKNSKPLPPGWEAGVMNAGQYYRWWLPEKHSVVFTVAIVVLVILVVFLIVSAIWATRDAEQCA